MMFTLHVFADEHAPDDPAGVVLQDVGDDVVQARGAERGVVVWFAGRVDIHPDLDISELPILPWYCRPSDLWDRGLHVYTVERGGAVVARAVCLPEVAVMWWEGDTPSIAVYRDEATLRRVHEHPGTIFHEDRRESSGIGDPEWD